MAKEGPTTKVAFEQKCEEANCMNIWEDGLPGGGCCKCKMLSLMGTWSDGGLAKNVAGIG